MKEKPISIIIPCYNAKKYLPRCVNSLIHQTIGLENMELIFVNDASTDDTLEYLYELEKQYPSTIKVISYSENQKMGITRNIGMSYATGKYIGFIDADDWILPQMYEEMYQKAEKTDCELVSSYVCQTESMEKQPRGRFKDESCDYSFHIQNEEQRKDLLARGMSVFGSVHVYTKLYRRDFLEKYQLRFGKKYAFEDLYFSDMAAFYVSKFCVMQAEYYHYQIHPNITMTSMEYSKWFEHRRIMIDWVEECISRGLFEKYYHEVEFIFGRDYYVPNLHYAFTHSDDDNISIIKNSQSITKTLFPNIEKNPYILQYGENYLYDCQKKFFDFIADNLSISEIEEIRKGYQDEILRIAKRELQLPEKQKNKIENKDNFSVMMAADANYFYPTMILITSLFHNHPDQKMTIYLLQKDFSFENLKEVQIIAHKWKNKEIHCIEITQKHLGQLKAFGRFSTAAFFRILGMTLIPESVQKILYLDADMIVNHNLTSLFSLEMQSPLAACYDINNYLQGNIEQHKELLDIPKNYSYFNSGMLLIDLTCIRKNKTAEKLLTDIQNNFDKYTLVDQDALNKYFHKKVQYLPWEIYNCPCIPLFSKFNDSLNTGALITYPEFYKQAQQIHYHDMTDSFIKNASIIHFCTSQKPWKDRSFYEHDNMKAAIHIYNKYEELYKRTLNTL